MNRSLIENLPSYSIETVTDAGSRTILLGSDLDQILDEDDYEFNCAVAQAASGLGLGLYLSGRAEHH